MVAAHCSRCGEPFEATRRGHRFCSAACRVGAARDRQRAEEDRHAGLSLVRGSGEGGSARSRPISSDSLLSPAVAEAIDNLQLEAADIGASRLARRYAAAIDDARQIAEGLEQVEVTDDNAQLLYALRAKVQAQTVLETLGPKLLGALESLGATPQARAKLKGGGARGGNSGGRLASIRADRTS